MAYPYAGRPVSFAHSNGGYYGGRTLYAGSTPYIPGGSLPIDAYGHRGYQGYPVISVPPSPYPMATQLPHYGYPTSTAYPITSAGYHASLDATRSCHSAADSFPLFTPQAAYDLRYRRSPPPPLLSPIPPPRRKHPSVPGVVPLLCAGSTIHRFSNRLHHR
jgi:hypothetical protein